ncbi:uracil phosphoribosyltransferase [Burkholderia thailandensis]|nr:uracil phosphoribosyltransferase [Burkholderia thailandensis]KXF62008.1 uracil phosphoribosyltransferase [Burkholderia thailandensis]PNE76232.1 uracil phosphoribosyltransferase [Burkholderia thailandensis]
MARPAALARGAPRHANDSRTIRERFADDSRTIRSRAPGCRSAADRRIGA